MTKVDKGKDEMMGRQEIHVLTVMTDEQGPEFVDPSKRAFAAEALFVDLGIEQPFASTLDGFTVAFVLGHIGNNAVIEANTARLTGIEGTIGIEVGARNRDIQRFDRLEGRLPVGLEVECIVMMTGHNPGRGQAVTLGIRDGQNVAGLGALAGLITHTFTSLLGKGVTAVQVQPRQVQVSLNARNAVLPDSHQAPVLAPLPKMVVHRLPTDLFFVGSVGSAATGSSAHWQPV